MKKIFNSVVALMLVAMLAVSCSKSDTASVEGKMRIGVLQLSEHQALASTYEGFKAGLEKAGYKDGENIIIDHKNAQGDQSNAITIADKLVNDKNDLIVAIATASAQAVANKTKTIPVLFTAITDPVAAGLADSLEKPNRNLTGTSDMSPLEAQSELILEFVPDVKKVAIVYSSSEINSQIQAKQMEELLKAKGVSVQHATIVTSNDVKQVIESLTDVDAIYTPTDNVISEAMVTVSDVCVANSIPLFAADPSGVENGALATYGIDYYKLGEITAEMAVEILRDGKNPSDMPIRQSEEYSLIINKNTADAIKFEIPKQALDRADRIIEE